MKPSLLLLAALALAGCHQPTRTAPFRARPDSTKAGQLSGPFTGQVIDAASGDPVAGALVYGSWTFESDQAPSGFREAVVSTDANGRYLIEKSDDTPAGRLHAFHLVVYKRGYVAYRSDRRFSDMGPRLDFAQRNNEVVLERWHSELSHARHLRYVGGGAAISALTAWEVDEASRELKGMRSSSGTGLSSDIMASLSDDRLIAAQLLGEEEIKAITDFDGKLESGTHKDEADTDSYSSQQFNALGQPEVFDVAFRIWRLDGEKDQRRFSELSDTLPGVSERDDVADQSLLAIEGDIQGYAFLDSKRGLVVLITCGKGQCREIQHLVDIAHKIHENIEAVLP